MTRPADTDPAAYDRQVAICRKMTGAQRLEVALHLTESVRTVMREAIRSRHPEYSVAQVVDAFNRLWLGDDLFRAAWPDRPLLSP